MKAEEILEKYAKKNMIQWNQEFFKRTHSRLHRTIIEAINEALTIPAVIKTSVCHEPTEPCQSFLNHGFSVCEKCDNFY